MKTTFFTTVLLLVALTGAACGGAEPGTPGYQDDSEITDPTETAPQLLITNTCTNDHCELNVSSCDSDSWGRNVLTLAGITRFTSGNSITVAVDPGCYDLRALGCGVAKSVERNGRVTVVSGSKIIKTCG